MAPTISMLSAQAVVVETPHRYYDRDHRDWHAWDNHEDFAYRAWGTEGHRNYVEYNRLPVRDQRNYWRWRHAHSDAVLQVNVR